MHYMDLKLVLQHNCKGNCQAAAAYGKPTVNGMHLPGTVRTAAVTGWQLPTFPLPNRVGRTPG
jgi:hypothetical protein